MTQPRKFDLICFDWDGTLFDSTAIIVKSIQAAVEDVGGERPTRQAASWVIGMGLREALAHAAPDVPPEKYPELGLRYRHHYALHQHDISLFEGVLPMLAQLKARHHWLAVATGKSRQGLDEALETLALKAMFDGSRTADETASKPHPRMLLELMRAFGADPERTLMVGDTTHDLQLAANAGCPCIGVSYGAHEPSGFEVFKPLLVAHSVGQLAHWLAVNA
jgi:phosphoglycolate phosphatase